MARQGVVAVALGGQGSILTRMETVSFSVSVSSPSGRLPVRCGWHDGHRPVSYTHLTLPTKA